MGSDWRRPMTFSANAEESDVYDRAAAALGISRSEFLRRAAAREARLVGVPLPPSVAEAAALEGESGEAGERAAQ